MSESSKRHKVKASKNLNFGVYICSTSRYKQIEQGEKEVSDIGGDTIVELLKNAGQNVLFKKIIADDQTMIQDEVMYVLGLSALDVAIFSDNNSAGEMARIGFDCAAFADGNMPYYARLPGNGNILFDHRAAGYTGLRDDQAIGPDLHIMGDLH